MSAWISVKERLPELFDDDGSGMMVSNQLLVYVACRKTIEFGECRKSLRTGKTYFRAYGFMGEFDITHWMPLPEPPQPPKEKQP